MKHSAQDRTIVPASVKTVAIVDRDAAVAVAVVADATEAMKRAPAAMRPQARMPKAVVIKLSSPRRVTKVLAKIRLGPRTTHRKQA